MPNYLPIKMSLPDKIFESFIKSQIPDGYQISHSCLNLISSIMMEINRILTEPHKKSSKELTPRIVANVAKRIIPEELHRYAFSNANRILLFFKSGLIRYEAPQERKIAILQPRHLEKGLEDLAGVAHDNLTISKDCSRVACGLMKRLAVCLADQSVERESGYSLENMRVTFQRILGPEIFFHAEGHAESNLTWYRENRLDFSLKPLSTEIEEDNQIKGMKNFIQKLAKTEFSVSVKNDAAVEMERILIDVMDRIVDERRPMMTSNGADSPEITPNDIQTAINNLFPGILCKIALSNAHGKVAEYSLGILKYKYKRPAVKADPTPEVEEVEEPVVPDFRKGIRRMMQQQNCLSGKGFLSFMNDILNDVADNLVEHSAKLVQIRNGLFSGDDVIASVNEVFPERLREHALMALNNYKQQIAPFQRSNGPIFQMNAESGWETDNSTEDIELRNEISGHVFRRDEDEQDSMEKME